MDRIFHLPGKMLDVYESIPIFSNNKIGSTNRNIQLLIRKMSLTASCTTMVHIGKFCLTIRGEFKCQFPSFVTSIKWWKNKIDAEHKNRNMDIGE